MKSLVIFMTATFFSLAIYSQSNCLVARYMFSGNAQDNSGNSFNGTVIGPVLTTDRFGHANSAYLFDGVDDVIEVASDAAFNFGPQDDFTLSMWIKVNAVQANTANGTNFIFSKFDDNNNNPGGFPYDIRCYNQTSGLDGKLTFYRRDLKSCGNKPSGISSSALNDNTYHHVVYVKENVNLRFYIDNVLEATVSDTTACTTGNSFKMRMGAKGGTWAPSYFKGVIDDVIIYNCPQDSAAIDSLFNVPAWTGLAERIESSIEMNVYPNPTNGRVIIESEGRSGIEQVDVLDASGRFIKKLRAANSARLELELPSQRGLYMLKVRTSDESIGYFRIVRE